MNSIAIGGYNARVRSSRAAIDTGTSLIAMDKSEAKIINKMIGASDIAAIFSSGMYTVDCADIPTLPNIRMNFGDVPVVLAPEDYIIRQSMFGISSPVCLSAFMGMDLPDHMKDLWIVGDVLLRKYYTVYDHDNHRVGFAKAA